MIQPQELRIDNLFQDKFTKDVFKVLEISKDKIVFDYKTDKIWQAEPIPLTEEILLKFGFKEVEGERWCDTHEEFEECNYYCLGAFKIYYNPETDKFEDDSLYDFNVNLKYVHSLQNIYFALTGEELTFKN